MARVIRGERGSMAYFEFLDFGDAGREKWADYFLQKDQFWDSSAERIVWL
jgi:hypothetical protein